MHRPVEQFFSSIEWSEKGQCHFAELRLSDGGVLNFLAASADCDDDSMLIQGMQALSAVGPDLGEYVARVCEFARKDIAPYMTSADKPLTELAEGLRLTQIETQPGRTILTLADTAGLIGGHVLNVYQNDAFEIECVKLEDQ